MRCLLSTRFGMTAEILRNGAVGDVTVDVGDNGQWKMDQDPISGDAIRVWVPVTSNPDEPLSRYVIDCEVRGIVDGGIRVAGTTERFGKVYDNVDFAEMRMPINVILTKRDRITNIKNKKTGEILWKEEELNKANGDFRATVFNVNGVTPEFDPFQRMISQFAMLARADA